MGLDKYGGDGTVLCKKEVHLDDKAIITQQEVCLTSYMCIMISLSIFKNMSAVSYILLLLFFYYQKLHF